MQEYGFELALCAHLESSTEGIVSRQLGAGVADPGGRVIDAVAVEPGPEFDERTAITPRRIPDAAIESDVGPGRFRYWKEAFDCHPDRARTAVDRAVDLGFFERERRNGREYVRQVARYPDWFSRIRGFENKPDLGSPGALETQLRTDASLGLFDEAILVTGSYVTGAHLNRIPEEIGVWRFDPGSDGEIEIVREPTPLDPAEPGVELLAELPGRSEIRIVSPDEKARQRRRIAERAYDKGWRTFELPGCAACSIRRERGASLPHCDWKGRLIDPAGCGPDCPGYDPADPPAVDLDAERASRSPWVSDPDGLDSTQAGLDRFG